VSCNDRWGHLRERREQVINHLPDQVILFGFNNYPFILRHLPDSHNLVSHNRNEHEGAVERGADRLPELPQTPSDPRQL